MWLKALVGIIIVFLVLIFLAYFIHLFGKLMNHNFMRRKSISKVNEDAEPEIIVENNGNPDEIAAVITAAIRAYLGTSRLTAECSIRVRPFNRVSSDSPVWNTTNKNELIDSLV
jgi:sodium pump decarboxylase gamma subunit